MKIIRQYIHREALMAVAFVTAGFLSLFFFFDLVDELRWIGRSGQDSYEMRHALLYVVLSIPSNLYELLPITVLIGTIFVMARLAQNSEFTIMRTSGVSPGGALRTLLTLGLMFTLLTFAVGDYVAPLADKAAQLVKSQHTGRLASGTTGAWLKERQNERSFSVNVRSLSTQGDLVNIRIFEFDTHGQLHSQTHANKAVIEEKKWRLQQVQRTEFNYQGQESSTVKHINAPEIDWATAITSDMVSAALINPDKMSTLDLFQYIQHLSHNSQATQKYEIEFWRKIFYPLSCLVMVVLALPFAYLHFRSGGIAGYVFAGVMAGISFFLLNNVFGFAGNLQNWSPWITAAAPGFIYSILSLAAFGWLVFRR